MKPKFTERATLEYCNPYQTGPSVYKRENVPVYRCACGRGMIVKVFNKWFDYLIDGDLKTQRAGANTEILHRAHGGEE